MANYKRCGTHERKLTIKELVHGGRKRFSSGSNRFAEDSRGQYMDSSVYRNDMIRYRWMDGRQRKTVLRKGVKIFLISILLLKSSTGSKTLLTSF